MSLLKSAYRPYAQLDDDDKDLLRHQTHQSYDSQTTSGPISPANGCLPAPVSAREEGHWPPEGFKGPRFATFALFCAALLFLGLLGVVAFKRHSSSPDGHVTKSDLLVASPGDEPPLTAFEEAVMVETVCGQMIGGVEDGAFAFKGMPYALPPKGHLRWSRPVPLQFEPRYCRRHHHRHATKFGSPCFQVNPYTKQFEGSEDCLYLNVWTPRLDDSAGLEVMVWIHGGFLQFGNGHQPGLRPSGKLAKNLNTVFVSFNYRLHALGFLALEQLANSGANSSFGNYGLWDQMVALEWVQQNIKSFGGDPRKVTVFGPDGGSASILAMASNPDSGHLFRSAWLVGPALYFNHSFEESSHHNHNLFLQRSGCSNAQCLRSLSPRNVLQLFLGRDDPSFRINDQNDLPIQGIFPEQLIVVDEELVTQPMPFTEGTIDLPLLVGTAAQAIEFWPGPNDLRTWNWSQYQKYVTTSLDSFGPGLSQLALQMYPAEAAGDADGNSSASISVDPSASSSTSTTSAYPSPSEMEPEMVYASMVSDVRQTCPVNIIAENITKSSKSPLYRYIVTAHPSRPVRVYDYDSMLSFHLWDAIAFFDQIETFVRHPSEQDYLFRDEMQRIAMNFVRGDYNEMWKSYPEQVALIDNNVTLAASYASERCTFWENQGLDNYVWVS